MSDRQGHHHQHRRNRSIEKRGLPKGKEPPPIKIDKNTDQRIPLLNSPSHSRSHVSLLGDSSDPKKINLIPAKQGSRAQSPYSKNNDSKGKILFSDDNVIPSALIDSSDAIDENYKEVKNYDIPPVKPPPAVLIKDFKRTRSSNMPQGEAPPLKIVEGSSQLKSLAYKNHKVIPLPPNKSTPQFVHKEEKKKARSNDPEQAQFVPAPLLVLGDDPEVQNPEINEEMIELEPHLHRRHRRHHHKEGSERKRSSAKESDGLRRHKRSDTRRSKSENRQVKENAENESPYDDQQDIPEQPKEKDIENKFDIEDGQKSSKKKRAKRTKKRNRSVSQKEEIQKEIPAPVFIEANDSSSFDDENQNIIERPAQPDDDTPRSLPSPKREESKKQLSFKERVGLLKMRSAPKFDQDPSKKDSDDDILIGRFELPPMEEEKATPYLPVKPNMPPIPNIEDGSELYGPVITEMPTTEAATNVFASYTTMSSKNIVYDDMVRRGINPVKPIEGFHTFQVPIIPGPDDSLLEKEAAVEFDLKLLMKNARS